MSIVINNYFYLPFFRFPCSGPLDFIVLQICTLISLSFQCFLSCSIKAKDDNEKKIKCSAQTHRKIVFKCNVIYDVSNVYNNIAPRRDVFPIAHNSR